MLTHRSHLECLHNDSWSKVFLHKQQPSLKDKLFPTECKKELALSNPDLLSVTVRMEFQNNASKRCIPASELKAPLLPKLNFSRFRQCIAKQPLKTTLFTILLFWGNGKRESNREKHSENKKEQRNDAFFRPGLTWPTVGDSLNPTKRLDKRLSEVHFGCTFLWFYIGIYQSFLKSSLDWLSFHNGPHTQVI